MTQAEEKFEPKKHVMQLKSREGSKDYLPVQWRLVWFREMCPQGTIDTEEMDVDLDREVEEEVSVWNNEKRRSEKVVKHAKGYARYKAIVTDGKGGRATGTKSENAASFPDFVEKAECVPLHSEILTREGFKTYDQLTIGEYVLAYDHLRDACVWAPLQRVTVYEDAPVSRLHGKTFDVLCTPDHSWATYSKTATAGRSYEYRDLTKAYKLRKHHRIVLAAPASGGTHPLSPRDAAILGWLITDGSIQWNGNSVRSYIAQSKQENVRRIRELVGTSAKETRTLTPDRTFPAGRTYACLPQHRFTFTSAETRRILAAGGVTSPADLPAMVSQYSHEARQAMLIAMMLADGDERGYFGKKRKPGVMEAWQILATLEGFALGAMYESSTGEVPIQRMKKRTMVCASELQMESAGKQDVWCPTTQYGTWVMRQNGRVMITGNTGAIGRALAGLGYGTQFAPELSEMPRIVDSPVERVVSHSDAAHNGTSNHSNANEHATPSRITEQQINSIRKLCEHLCKPELTDLERFSYLDGKTTINQLSAEYRELKEGERTKPAVTAESMNIAGDPINTGQLRGIEDLLINKLQRPFVREAYQGLTSMQAAGLIQQLTSEWNVVQRNKANNRAQVGAK